MGSFQNLGPILVPLYIQKRLMFLRTAHVGISLDSIIYIYIYAHCVSIVGRMFNGDTEAL